MATKDYIPADLLRQMEESGIKFDENGEVIDPDNFLDNEKDQSEDQTYDQQDDTDNEDDSQDESEDDNDQSSKETLDEDDTEEDDEPAPKKKTKVASEEKSSRLVLTPKSKDEPEVNTEVMDLRRELSEIKALLAAKKSETPKEDDGEIGSTLRREAEYYRKEAEKFRKLRGEDLISGVENRVNSNFPQTSFKDIVASKEWEQYQNSRVMGARVGDLFLTTIQSEEKDDVVSFFTDFVDRYLPSLSKATPIAAAMKKAVKSDPNKAKLEDLAVPDKTKSAVSKPKRTGFDFTTSDYAKALDQAERGKMSVAQFTKFEEGFFKAEREGRVKQD